MVSTTVLKGSVHGPEATASFPPTSEESEHDGVRFAIPELDPARLKEASATTSDFDRCLRVGALRVDANVWSVKDFIQQMAYVQGLSHAGKPTAPTETFSRSHGSLFRKAPQPLTVGLGRFTAMAQVASTRGLTQCSVAGDQLNRGRGVDRYFVDRAADRPD